MSMDKEGEKKMENEITINGQIYVLKGTPAETKDGLWLWPCLWLGWTLALALSLARALALVLAMVMDRK